jgi:hypothetical protein
MPHRRYVLGLAAVCLSGPLVFAQVSNDRSANFFARDHILQVEIQMAPEVCDRDFGVPRGLIL